MVNKYSFQKYNEGKMVRVLGRNLPVSKKASREICHFIKGKEINKAINYLEGVTKLKLPIPFKRFKKDIAHRRGKIGPGRFPRKSAHSVLNLLNTLKANAKDKGLNSEGLVLIHSAVSPGPILMHYGRHRGSRRKMCNIELVAEEVVTKKPKKSKSTKKKVSKKEQKSEKKTKQVNEDKPTKESTKETKDTKKDKSNKETKKSDKKDTEKSDNQKQNKEAKDQK